MPAIYDSGQPDLADEFLLGRATDWIGPEARVACGARMSTVSVSSSPGAMSRGSSVRAPSQTTARELMSNQ